MYHVGQHAHTPNAPLRHRHPASSLALALIATLFLTFVIGVAAAAVTDPTTLSCPNGQTVFLEGQSAPNEGLLIFLEKRAVGGGSANASGAWRLPLKVSERPGIYRVEVQSRASRTVVGRFICYVDVPLEGVVTATSEIVVTAAPSATSGVAATSTRPATGADVTATPTRTATGGTPTTTQTATRTLTGTPPTATRTPTRTATGTPPTATRTVTGTPATPTVKAGEEAEVKIIFVVVADPDNEDNVESIEISNDSKRPIDLTGWRVVNSTRSDKPTYTIPSFELPAGESMIIYTDLDGSEEDVPEFNEFYWARSDNVWRVNDVVQLYDKSPGGDRLIFSYTIPAEDE